jgi:hypothetical protein
MRNIITHERFTMRSFPTCYCQNSITARKCGLNALILTKSVWQPTRFGFFFLFFLRGNSLQLTGRILQRLYNNYGFSGPLVFSYEFINSAAIKSEFKLMIIVWWQMI